MQYGRCEKAFQHLLSVMRSCARRWAMRYLGLCPLRVFVSAWLWDCLQISDDWHVQTNANVQYYSKPRACLYRPEKKNRHGSWEYCAKSQKAAPSLAGRDINERRHQKHRAECRRTPEPVQLARQGSSDADAAALSSARRGLLQLQASNFYMHYFRQYHFVPPVEKDPYVI
jgi:hypothetical protein